MAKPKTGLHGREAVRRARGQDDELRDNVQGAFARRPRRLRRAARQPGRDRRRHAASRPTRTSRTSCGRRSTTSAARPTASRARRPQRPQRDAAAHRHRARDPLQPGDRARDPQVAEGPDLRRRRLHVRLRRRRLERVELEPAASGSRSDAAPSDPMQLTPRSRGRGRRERPLQRAGIEAARARDVRDLQQDRARLRARARRSPIAASQPATVCRSGCPAGAARPARYGRRVDGAVVAHAEQRDRMDLEVEVVRRALRVAGVADEAEHLARVHARAVHGERRVGGEMRVVELVALASRSQSRLPPSVVPADREDRAVGARRGPARRAAAKMSSP